MTAARSSSSSGTSCNWLGCATIEVDQPPPVDSQKPLWRPGSHTSVCEPLAVAQVSAAAGRHTQVGCRVRCIPARVRAPRVCRRGQRRPHGPVRRAARRSVRTSVRNGPRPQPGPMRRCPRASERSVPSPDRGDPVLRSRRCVAADRPTPRRPGGARMLRMQRRNVSARPRRRGLSSGSPGHSGRDTPPLRCEGEQAV